MINSIGVILVVVSIAALAMLGVNIYLMLQSRKKKPEDEGRVILHQRLDSLSKLVSDQLEQSRQSTERATLSVHQQVEGFTRGMTQVHEAVRTMQESVKNVVSFQDIFKSPKLRGTWGELSLDSILNQYFPRDIYEMQHYFKSGEAVDAVLKLPNGMLLPIDSKFNWENFEKMVNAGDDINKDIHRKQFYSDVKKKIDEIASKYILPAESTTDMAMMYVPAETIYYEIINHLKDVDLASYARSKKIFLVSPNTFAISVSAVMHWFKDVEFNKQTKEIMKKLDRIVTDSDKLAEGFRRLGKHISDASSAYEDNEKRLTLMVDRVKNVVELGQAEETRGIDAPRV
ncbi:MAG: hypothetical protein A2750_00625 [Candidatus Yanofskybacteria bacterium RIFCSPHIGHO2_01_FULL_45_42]|uniref:DNA recombination protein RmuC n=3 Tax=Candidatus Yanofskyibacteriota TaxID=1752733 RepID=A0A1F8H456_9BACT|nr:MAG: hypothetical protein A2750_00625 [Candidatus Yanofskybacteria bacterium RIFCSPHIGHO2_01_FULL_45_42]OGN16376.1 MAG: hypothetical protein A3C81_02865 [Candidatus Yanofskybacteria bacterium RIFCSPHIGHO2_02_FULL_46_19]OGN26841.1 MAG: hypothetical protein A3B17_00380 [Candidatus Yanofskybacteria bacterium RIFCSPLOWO2_01_FULL_45_72]OGN32373.1 MAG: hypothetical protein A3J01_00415 [Candidatus Yanofskybacteria bacterium RIFCSPLOWO2_02_FULL_45_18]